MNEIPLKLNTCRCTSNIARVNREAQKIVFDPMENMWHPSYWFNLILDRLEVLLHNRKEARKAAETAAVLAILNKHNVPPPPQSFKLHLNFLQTAFSALSCPVCRELASPPLLMCKTGHFICGFCVENVLLCPLCAERYTTARCYALEDFASVIQVRCRHILCKQWVKLSCLKSHMEKFCEFRPIMCNIPFKTRCKSQAIEFLEYPGHLLKAHSAVNSLSRKVAYCIVPAALEKGSGKWVPRPFLHRNYPFILNAEIKNSVLLIWVTGICSKLSASEHLAEIHLGNNCDAQGQVSSKCTFKWFLDIMTVQTEMNEMRRSCFAKIPLSKFSTFSDVNDNDGSYYFYVEPNILTNNTAGTEDHLPSSTSSINYLVNSTESILEWFARIHVGMFNLANLFRSRSAASGSG